MTEIILAVLTGLVLFLYAVKALSDTLKNYLSEQSKEIIGKYTSNLLSAILLGTIVTIILDSSSAVIIMIIVLVNARILTFRQSIGIVMGANIGTTFSSQIIALQIGEYSAIPLVIGLVLIMVSKSEFISKTGKVLLFFGILFFGLYTMERAVEPLRDHPHFAEWMANLDNPIRGAFTGALVTLIIQSSSATVGMAITLAKKGLISLAGGLAVMIGAELGTCSDTLIATINTNRQALKVALFHLVFNLMSIILGLLFFVPFVALVAYISPTNDLENQIANGHVIFNVAGVVLFVWFIPLFERLLNRLIPNEKPPPQIA